MSESNAASADDALEMLVRQVAVHAFNHEDAEEFFEWAGRILPKALAHGLANPDGAVDVRGYYWIARAVWNATPLPSNGFLPKPLFKPEPEAPCPCGSGDRYSACCRTLAKPPSPSPTYIWSMLVPERSDRYWLRAARAGRLPVIGVFCIAESWHALENWKPLSQLTKAQLSAPQDCPREVIACLVDWLSDAYDNLHRTPRKEVALLTKRFVKHEMPALRAAANRRLATALWDLGDREGSRKAHAEALRAEPESVATALFDVTMSAIAGEWGAAAERAAQWHARLRDKDDAAEDRLARLHAMAKDPRRVFEDLRVQDVMPPMRTLLDWIDRNIDRSLPRLRWNALGASADDAALRDAYQPVTGRNRRIFEEEWQELSGMAKPRGTAPFSGAEFESWLRCEEWVEWLRGHTQALDSMTILDDLAILLDSVHKLLGIRNRWRSAVLTRGFGIVEKHWPPDRAGKLPWALEANRPTLRLLASYVDDQLGDWTDARRQRAVSLYLRLNPTDDHGIRRRLVNELLDVGLDAEALAHAQSHADALCAETRYGAVLALYRLGRLDEAETQCRKATADLPLVAKYLLRDRIRPPKKDKDGPQPGGKKQAWHYRLDMRMVWTSTDGALEWLARHASGPGS